MKHKAELYDLFDVQNHAVVAKNSRLPGFYELSPEERRQLLAERCDLDADELRILAEGGMSLELADRMAENVVGVYGLPLGSRRTLP
jgi:hydroxymethylglutaryl-CoA reductase